MSYSPPSSKIRRFNFKAINCSKRSSARSIPDTQVPRISWSGQSEMETHGMRLSLVINDANVIRPLCRPWAVSAWIVTPVVVTMRPYASWRVRAGILAGIDDLRRRMLPSLCCKSVLPSARSSRPNAHAGVCSSSEMLMDVKIFASAIVSGSEVQDISCGEGTISGSVPADSSGNMENIRIKT